MYTYLLANDLLQRIMLTLQKLYKRHEVTAFTEAADVSGLVLADENCPWLPFSTSVV